MSYARQKTALDRKYLIIVFKINPIKLKLNWIYIKNHKMSAINFISKNNFFLFDIYIIIFLFGYGIQLLTINYLIQDKICNISYNQSKYFCQHINENIFNDNEKLIKDKILASSALYNNYLYLIKALPMFVWSLFFGSFLDRQIGATRIIFAWMNIIGIIIGIFVLYNIFNFLIDPYYLLLSGISVYFDGSMATFLTVTHRYIIINTELKHRTIRLTIFQISMLVAISLGSLVGGNLIHLVDDRGDLLRNYDLNIWIYFGLNILCLFIILIIKIDRKDLNINKNQKQINETSNLTKTENKKFSICNQFNDVCGKFFDFKNVRETIHCLTKKRENKIREQMIIIIALLFIQFLNYQGLDAMFLQFSQKVYQFDAKTYANISGISKILPNIGLLIGAHVLIKLLKWKDGTIYALTLSSTIISQIIIGIFTNPNVYLIALVIGSIGGLSSIVMKTEISQLTPKDEVGKIFSLISTLESLAPFLGTSIFSIIFSASVSTYPTLIFHVAAAISLLILIMTLFKDLYYHNDNINKNEDEIIS